MIEELRTSAMTMYESLKQSVEFLEKFNERYPSQRISTRIEETKALLKEAERVLNKPK